MQCEVKRCKIQDDVRVETFDDVYGLTGSPRVALSMFLTRVPHWDST